MAATYTERVQTVLNKRPVRPALCRSAGEQKAISVLIRDAIEEVYFAEQARRRRRLALAELIALDAPVDDWSEMEQEIIEGAMT